MDQRAEVNAPAQITFTNDFHELVRGNLRPGRPVVISYDPERVVPNQAGYVFGDLAQRITVSARFAKGGEPVTTELRPLGGGVDMAHRDRDPTGQGAMLRALLDVPDNAELLSVWFTYQGANGCLAYDSDFGANFNFRFADLDVGVVRREVRDSPNGQTGLFSLEVWCVAAADRLTVRVSRLAEPYRYSQEYDLTLDGWAEVGVRRLWRLDPVPVARGSVVRFKIYYWIEGLRFKDDNAGHYYVAPEPEQEEVPLPPAELERAALAWK